MFHACFGFGDVDLHDLAARDSTAVGHGAGSLKCAVSLLLHVKIGVGKGSVGKSVAKGIRHVHAKGGIVAVAYVNIFIVNGIGGGAGEVFACGGRKAACRPRNGGLGTRVDVAAKHLGNRRAGLFTCISRPEHRVCHVLPGKHFYG